MTGRWREATDAAQAAEAILGADNPYAAINRFMQMVVIRGEQDRLDRYEPVMAAAAAANPQVIGYRAHLARVRVDAGDAEGAAEIVSAMLGADFGSDGGGDIASLHSLWCLAYAGATAADEAGAATVYGVALPLAGLFSTALGVAPNGSVDHVLGLLATRLGRYDAAVGHLTESLRIHEQIGSPWLAAHTKVAWADALLRRGRGRRC